jgi:superfamily I DNA/RNA helicase
MAEATVLGRNFRSRAEILEAAVRCVSHNERRAGKALIAMRGPGGQVRVRAFQNEYAEANRVAAQIADALARTGYAPEPLQRALAHAGIPHRVLGSLGPCERAEVRDALAYLTLIQNPLDAQAYRRAIGSPRRGISAATVTKLVAWAREHHRGDRIAASARSDEHDEHATLTGFLEQAAGLHSQELDAAGDRRITVSMIHRAKGTEASAVALLGCEEELLPSWRSISSPDPERLAEERRLFYVAAARA